MYILFYLILFLIISKIKQLCRYTYLPDNIWAFLLVCLFFIWVACLFIFALLEFFMCCGTVSLLHVLQIFFPVDVFSFKFLMMSLVGSFWDDSNESYLLVFWPFCNLFHLSVSWTYWFPFIIDHGKSGEMFWEEVIKQLCLPYWVPSILFFVLCLFWWNHVLSSPVQGFICWGIEPFAKHWCEWTWKQIFLLQLSLQKL